MSRLSIITFNRHVPRGFTCTLVGTWKVLWEEPQVDYLTMSSSLRSKGTVRDDQPWSLEGDRV